MPKEVIVNMTNVNIVAQTMYKCLKQLREMGTLWNMAELAVAYTELCHELLKDMEKQLPKQKGG